MLLLNLAGAVLTVAVVVLWAAGWPYLAGACAAVALVAAVAMAWRWRGRP